MEGGKYKQELPFSNSLCAVSGLPQLLHKAFLDILLNMDIKGTGIIQVTITCHYLQYFSFFSKTKFQQYFCMPHVSPQLPQDQGVKPQGSKIKNVKCFCHADTLQQITVQ